MQIVFDVLAKPSVRGSLREMVIADLQQHDWVDDEGRPLALEVHSEKKPGRRSGWAKIKAKGIPRAINISWHAHSKTLIGRAVGKQGNNPSDLVGRFLTYLLWKRRKDISAVIIRTL